MSTMTLSAAESDEPECPIPENERRAWEDVLVGRGSYTAVAAQVQQKLAQASSESQRNELYKSLASTLSWYHDRCMSVGIIVSALLSTGPHKQEFEKIRDGGGHQSFEFFRNIQHMRTHGNRHQLQTAQATTMENWGQKFVNFAIAYQLLDKENQHFWDRMRAASRRVNDWEIARSMMNMIAINIRKTSKDWMSATRNGMEILKAENFEGIKNGAPCLTEDFARQHAIVLDNDNGIVRFDNWDSEVVPAFRNSNQTHRRSTQKTGQARVDEQRATEQAGNPLLASLSRVVESASRQTHRQPDQEPRQQRRRANEVDDSVAQTSGQLVSARQTLQPARNSRQQPRQAKVVEESAEQTSGQPGSSRQTVQPTRNPRQQSRQAKVVDDTAEKTSGQPARTSRQQRGKANEVDDSAAQTSGQLGSARQTLQPARNSRQHIAASDDVHVRIRQDAPQAIDEVVNARQVRTSQKRQATRTQAEAPAGEDTQRQSPKRLCIRRDWSEELQKALTDLKQTMQTSSDEARDVVTDIDATDDHNDRPQVSRFELATHLLGSGVKEAQEWSPNQDGIDWLSQKQNKDRDKADIWNLTVEQSCRLADSHELGFEKPVIVRTCDLSFIKSQLLDVILLKTEPNTLVNVLGSNGEMPSLMKLPTAVAEIRQGIDLQTTRQFHSIEIPSIPSHLFSEGRPDFLSHPRFSLLDVISSRLEMKDTTTQEQSLSRVKQARRPTDIEKSQEVYSLSSRYAHTSFHQDPYGCTWFKCLTGIKAFFFIKSGSRLKDPQKPDARQMYGVLLRPGDILFMPADPFMTYAVITLEGPCLVVGGQTLDRQCLLPQLQQMFGILRKYEKTHAKELAAQLPDLFDGLMGYFEDDTTGTDRSELLTELRKLQSEIREELL